MNIISLLLISIATGLLFSIAEHFALGGINQRGFFFSAATIDIAVSLFLALLFAVLYAIFLRKKSRRGPHSLLTVFLVCTNAFFMGILLSNFYMPQYRFTHPVSLLIDAAILAACIAAGKLMLLIGDLVKKRLPAAAALSAPVYFVAAVAVFLAMAASMQGTATRDSGVKGRHVAADAPPVIFILVDALRYDRLHSAGNPINTSPTLDSFITESAGFTRAFAQSTWTKSSIASIFTGLYPQQHTTLDVSNSLPGDIYTYIEAFQKNGYRTGAFSANVNISPSFGFDQGFDHFYTGAAMRLTDATVYGLLFARLSPSLTKGLRGHRASFITPAEIILQHADEWFAAQKGAPFFAYIHLNDLHDPYEAPAPYTYKYFTPDMPKKTYHELAGAMMREIEHGKKPSPDDVRLRALLALYDAQIKYVDDNLATFFVKLKKQGIYDKSLIIICADHGEEFGEHGHFSHGHGINPSLLHVPLFIRFPGGRNAGVVTVPVALSGSIPTAAEFAGVPIPSDRPIGSFLGALNKKTPYSPQPVYSRIEMKGGMHESVIDWPWLLIRYRMGPGAPVKTKLFNLENGYGPQKNLAGTRKSTAAALTAILDRISAGKARTRASKVKIDKDTKNKLKGLGYIK